MIREQRIMQRMVDEIGDELNEYIRTFNGCDFWKIKEGEIIVNKTFKRLLSIIADFNLITINDILTDTYELVDSPELNLQILKGFSTQYIKHGGKSIVNRTMAFCFMLWLMVDEFKVPPTEILHECIQSELMYKKESIWENFKFALGFAPFPYKLRGDNRALCLVTLLNGLPIYDTMKNIAVYNELV